MPLTDTAAVVSTTRKVREVKQSTQYFDGLGRPVQKCFERNKWKVEEKTLVAPVIYDNYGERTIQVPSVRLTVR